MGKTVHIARPIHLGHIVQLRPLSYVTKLDCVVKGAVTRRPGDTPVCVQCIHARCSSRSRPMTRHTVPLPNLDPPRQVSQALRNLLRALLRHRREQRLGSTGGAAEILAHPGMVECQVG